MIFEELYQEYSQKVFRLCRGYTNDQEWAKDLTQDIFIQVWNNLDKFRGEASVGTWIFRIASNMCLRQLDKKKKVKNVELPNDLKIDADNTISNQIDILSNCIAQLEKPERIIISLVLEEQPYPEIASIMGISEGTLRVKIHRIKQKLTELYKDYEKN